MNSIDNIVHDYFLGIRTQGMTEFMYMVSRIFDVSVYSIIVTALIAVLIYYIRGKKYSLLFGTTMFLGAFVSYLLKIFFKVARPPQAVFESFSQSFPSYHAVIVTVFFVMMVYIFNDFWLNLPKGNWVSVKKPNILGRNLFNIFCAFIVIIVSFSRLYLGVHWFSDVLGGIVLGLILSFGSIIYFKRKIML